MYNIHYALSKHRSFKQTQNHRAVMDSQQKPIETGSGRSLPSLGPAVRTCIAQHQCLSTPSSVKKSDEIWQSLMRHMGYLWIYDTRLYDFAVFFHVVNPITTIPLTNHDLGHLHHPKQRHTQFHKPLKGDGLWQWVYHITHHIAIIFEHTSSVGCLYLMIYPLYGSCVYHITSRINLKFLFPCCCNSRRKHGAAIP